MLLSGAVSGTVSGTVDKPMWSTQNLVGHSRSGLLLFLMSELETE